MHWRTSLTGSKRTYAISGRVSEPVLANITVAAQVSAAVKSADVVIEAAPERLELKRKIF